MWITPGVYEHLPGVKDQFLPNLAYHISDAARLHESTTAVTHRVDLGAGTVLRGTEEC